MNKGVVFEVKDQYSIVLSDGKYIRIKNLGDMTIGQNLIFTEDDLYNKKHNMNYNFGYRFIAAVASFLLVFGISYFMYDSNQVYTITNVDINPSFEMELNKRDKVLRVNPLNEDALKLGKLDLKGSNIEDAVEKIVIKAKEKEFINEIEDSYVMVTTIPIREKSESSEIGLKIKEKIKRSEVLQSVNVATVKTTKKIRDEAIKNKVPVGIYSQRDKVDIKKYDTVKKFFKEDKNKDMFRKNGDIVENKKNKINKIKEEKEEVKDLERIKEKDKKNILPKEKVKEEVKTKEEKDNKKEKVKEKIERNIEGKKVSSKEKIFEKRKELVEAKEKIAKDKVKKDIEKNKKVKK